MNAEQTSQLIAQMLEAKFPGRYRAVSLAQGALPPGVPDVEGWVLEEEGTYCYVRVAQTSYPFVWLKFGISHATPPTEELAFAVAAANKDLVVGRAYLAAGDDVAMVVLDETIFAAPISWEHEPSVQDLLQRVATGAQQAGTLQRNIRGRFGGRSFQADDWMLLML